MSKQLLGFWFSSDLTLDVFPEYQWAGNLGKDFRCSASTAYDDRSIAQDPTHRWFFDDDAFDSLEKEFDGTAIGEAGLYDDSFVGNGHLGGVSAHHTDGKKNNRC